MNPGDELKHEEHGHSPGDAEKEAQHAGGAATKQVESAGAGAAEDALIAKYKWDLIIIGAVGVVGLAGIIFFMSRKGKG